MKKKLVNGADDNSNSFFEKHTHGETKISSFESQNQCLTICSEKNSPAEIHFWGTKLIHSYLNQNFQYLFHDSVYFTEKSLMLKNVI